MENIQEEDVEEEEHVLNRYRHEKTDSAMLPPRSLFCATRDDSRSMLSPRSLVGATSGRDDSRSMISPRSLVRASWHTRKAWDIKVL